MKAPEKSRFQRPGARMMRSGGALGALALASVMMVSCAHSDRAASILSAPAEVTASTPTTAPTTTLTTPEIPDGNTVGPTDSGISVEVWNAANKFNESVTLPFGNNYGGITFGFENVDSLVVFLTERTDSLEAEVRDYLALPEEKVSFRDAAITWVALNELNLRMQADLPELYDRFGVVGVGINSELKVFVSTECPLVEEELAELRHTYNEEIAFEVSEGTFMNAVDREPENVPVIPDCGN